MTPEGGPLYRERNLTSTVQRPACAVLLGPYWQLYPRHLGKYNMQTKDLDGKNHKDYTASSPDQRMSNEEIAALCYSPHLSSHQVTMQPEHLGSAGSLQHA